MNALRRLLPFGFLALLGGCTSGPCVGPSEISEVFSITPDRSCSYKLTITDIDTHNYYVKGKPPFGAPDSPRQGPVHVSCCDLTS